MHLVISLLTIVIIEQVKLAIKGYFCFACFLDALRPCQQSLVMFGRFPTFLCQASTRQRIKCLTQGYNTVAHGERDPLIPCLTFYR